MKGHLCQINDTFQTDIFLLSVVNFTFLVPRCIRKIGCFYFAVEILKLITSHLHTDDIKEKISFVIPAITKYSSLISVGWKIVMPNFFTFAIMFREASECNLVRVVYY